MHTVLLALLLLLVASLVVLLFLPLRLVVDTRSDTYRLRWGPVHAAVYWQVDELRYRMHVPFYTRDGAVSELLDSDRSTPRAPARPRAPQRRSTFWPPVRALLRSFRVRRFRFVLDTGDPLWNAWLFPVFHQLRRHGRDLSISFTGRNELQLDISNNAYRLLKAVLLSRNTKHQQP